MTTQAEAWTTESMRARIEEMFRALNDHDADRFVSCLTDDVVWTDPTSARPVMGREAVKQELTAFWRAFPDMRFPAEEVHIYQGDDPTRAVSSWQAVGTMTGPLDPPGFGPTGKSLSVRGICMYQFLGGRCERHTMIFDMLGFLQSLGLLPGVESMTVKAYAGAQRTTKSVLDKIRRS